MEREAVSGWRLAASKNRAAGGLHCRDALSPNAVICYFVFDYPLTANR
jgi:hypothetical protein